LSICEPNETRKPNRVVIIIFVDFKLFFSVEVSNPDLFRLEAVAIPSALSIFELTFCESLQAGETLCHYVMGTEYSQESAVCIYILRAFLISLKYIDLDKKYYFNLHEFIYEDTLSLERQYAENNSGKRGIGPTVE
jgi:hypothetical protein